MFHNRWRSCSVQFNSSDDFSTVISTVIRCRIWQSRKGKSRYIIDESHVQCDTVFEESHVSFDTCIHTTRASVNVIMTIM